MGDKSNTKRGISHDQLRKIWHAVGQNNWLDTLRQFQKDKNFTPGGQNVLKGKCIHPDHVDTDPSSYLYVDKGYYKCFGCGYYERNPIVFMKHILGTTQVEALQHLTEKFKIKVLSKKAQAELEAQQHNQRLKQEIYSVTHSLMCDALADPGNEKNEFAKIGLDYLINTRGIDKDTLHALPVGIVPTLKVLTKKIFQRYGIQKQKWDLLPELNRPPEPENLAKEAGDYLRDTLDPTFVGALLFPLHISPAEIGRIKLRVPSSAKQIRFPADPFVDMLGLYGLGWDQYTVFTNQKSSVDYMYVTEGEFDVLTIMSEWVAAGRVPFPITSAGGSGAKEHIEPILESSGFDEAYLVGDAPKNSGNRIVGEWLANFRSLDVKVFSGWGNLPNSCDLDEATRTHGAPTVEKALLTDFDKNFSPAWLWVYENLCPVLDVINTADFRKITETAAIAGRMLRNNLEQLSFCDAVANQYNLNASRLRREITSHEDTELGFQNRLADALQDLMYVVGNELNDNKRSLVLYAKKTKDLHRINIDSDQFVSELSPIIGTLYQFINEHVGLPGYLEGPDDTEGLVMENLDKRIRFTFKQAMITLTQGSPIMSTMQYRQGYHYLTLPDHSKVEYIVCGPDIYYIKRDGATYQYVPLEGPSHNGVVFNIHEGNGQTVAPWLPGGMSLEKLKAGAQTDIKKLYNDLVEIFDYGYTFKHQRVTCELLAALMLLYPINTALSRQILLFITGDTNSGKSSLLSMFADTGYRGIQMLHCSNGEDNYTTASVASTVNCSSQLLVLDEFESSDLKKGDHVLAIAEMFRGLIAGSTKRTLGQPGGKGHTTQHFNMPVIFAAIQGADKPQDLNRLLVVEMEKQESKDSPVTTILQKYGSAKVDEMGQQIATCMYPHAMTVAKHEQTVKEDFGTLQASLPFNVSYRLASALFGVMGIMELVGKDWRAFFKEYMLKNKALVQRATSTNESDSFLSTILRNPITLLDDGQASKTTIMKLLMDSENRSSINDAAWGTYYDEDNNHLMLLLDTIMHTMVPYHMKSRGMLGSRLKEVLGRHKMALNPQEIQRSGIISKATPVLGAGIREQDVVVFNTTIWLESLAEFEKEMEESAMENIPVKHSDESKPIKQELAANDNKTIEEAIEEKDASDFEWDE